MSGIVMNPAALTSGCLAVSMDAATHLPVKSVEAGAIRYDFYLGAATQVQVDPDRVLPANFLECDLLRSRELPLPRRGTQIGIQLFLKDYLGKVNLSQGRRDEIDWREVESILSLKEDWDAKDLRLVEQVCDRARLSYDPFSMLTWQSYADFIKERKPLEARLEQTLISFGRFARLIGLEGKALRRLQMDPKKDSVRSALLMLKVASPEQDSLLNLWQQLDESAQKVDGQPATFVSVMKIRVNAYLRMKASLASPDCLQVLLPPVAKPALEEVAASPAVLSVVPAQTTEVIDSVKKPKILTTKQRYVHDVLAHFETQNLNEDEFCQDYGLSKKDWGNFKKGNFVWNDAVVMALAEEFPGLSPIAFQMLIFNQIFSITKVDQLEKMRTRFLKNHAAILNQFKEFPLATVVTRPVLFNAVYDQRANLLDRCLQQTEGQAILAPQIESFLRATGGNIEHVKSMPLWWIYFHAVTGNSKTAAYAYMIQRLGGPDSIQDLSPEQIQALMTRLHFDFEAGLEAWMQETFGLNSPTESVNGLFTSLYYNENNLKKDWVQLVLMWRPGLEIGKRKRSREQDLYEFLFTKQLSRFSIAVREGKHKVVEPVAKVALPSVLKAQPAMI